MTGRQNMFDIKCAGVVFQIIPVEAGLPDYCEDYLEETIAVPDHVVELTKEDLERERKDAREYYGEDRDFGIHAQRTALLRKLAELLILHDTLLLHASAIMVDGKAYLFTAGSETGKTTHARLWMERLGDRAAMINDDKPFLQFQGSQITVFGNPWNGKERIGNNIAAPLAGIICLYQAEQNAVREMNRTEKWNFLLNQLYRSENPEHAMITMKLLDQLIQRVPVKALYCNRSMQAAEMACKAMLGQL